ncbi:GumC family protein [Sphingomonas solaris]|nr:Wzz/FepE/Etk N-terminal domain-containing protein [Sphingomonas solaris]
MEIGTTDAVRPSADRDETTLLDLRQIALTIRRRLWWVMAVVAIVLGLTVVAYMLVPRRYSATATVALDRQVEELVAQPKGDGTLPTDSPSVDTEVQVLTSPRLTGEVVDALNLGRRAGFGQPDDGTVVPPEQARQRAVRRLMSGLSAKRVGTSYAIAVSYAAPDPALSAAIVNRTIDQYVDDQRTGRVGDRDRETMLLRERMGKLRSDVIAAEAAVARYRAATNLIDVQKDSTATQQEISILNTQLATAAADRAAAVARLNAGVGADASPVIGALRAQQAQLSAQRAELAGRYGPLHPDLAKIDRSLTDVNASIGKESDRIRQGLAAEARVAEGRAGAIRSALSSAEGGLMAGNNASVQLNELLRTAESARTLYQSLLDRYQQSVAGQGTERSRSSVVAYALVPTGHTFPNPAVFGVAGLMAALIAAGAVVLVLELLESGFKSRRDVESKLGLPVLGNVPDLATIPGVSYSRRDPLGPPDYLVENEASVFGEAFRSIRNGAHIEQGERGIRSLAVCSALPNEGKTTTAICLARSAAMAGLKTVLIDCDLRRRASSRSMAAEAQKGLTDLLKGDATFDEVAVRDASSDAWVLPQGDGKSGYDLITQSAMQTLIDTLAGRFDLVVLDTAPVLPLAEARAVAAMADGVLLVTRWRKTPVQAAKLATDLLGRAGARIVGVALTRVNLKEQARAGDGDEMIYYNQFAGYYS